MNYLRIYYIVTRNENFQDNDLINFGKIIDNYLRRLHSISLGFTW